MLVHKMINFIISNRLLLHTLQGYVLKLTSSLSTSTYDYTLPEVQFAANVSYRHFTLHFDAQVCQCSL